MLLTAEARARHVPQVGFFRASADSQFSTSRRTCGFAVAAAVKPQETMSDCELRLNKQLLEKARSICMMRSRRQDLSKLQKAFAQVTLASALVYLHFR